MTLKEFIFRKLDKDGYVLDQEVATFLKREPNCATVEKYKSEYYQLKNAKEYFKDIKDYELLHSNRRYLIRDVRWKKGVYKQIPRIYYDYLKFN